MFMALHSATRNTTTLHAASCRRVATKRSGEVRQALFQCTTLDEAKQVVAEDDTDRKLTVCKCAKAVTSGGR